MIFYRYIPKCPDCLKNKFAYNDEENPIPIIPNTSRFFTECGTQLSENDGFCRECGNKI